MIEFAYVFFSGLVAGRITNVIEGLWRLIGEARMPFLDTFKACFSHPKS